MTSISSWWFSFVTAFLRPFIKASQDKLKLEHAIETDRVSAQNRHIEAIMESQRELAQTMKEAMEDSNAVLKEWLEGFHKLPTTATKALPVNDDERMWRLEMEELARQHGKALADNLSSYDIEAIVRQGLNDL